MGVSLSFSSAEPVSPEVEQALRADLGSLGGQPWVLCEPPNLHPGAGDGLLHGGSKLNLHPWADELESARQAGAEQDDLAALIRLLCDWSRRFGLAWELSLDGMPLGRIEGGICTGDVEGALEALAGLAQYLGEEFPREDGDEPGAGEAPPRLRIWPGPEDEVDSGIP